MLSLIDSWTLHNTCERMEADISRVSSSSLPRLAVIAAVGMNLFACLWIRDSGPEVAAADDVIKSVIVSPKAL